MLWLNRHPLRHLLLESAISFDELIIIWVLLFCIILSMSHDFSGTVDCLFPFCITIRVEDSIDRNKGSLS
jgi:hypothetical protein